MHGYVDMFFTYLNQFKVDYFHNCCAKHGVYSIFCTMAHGIEAPIASPFHSFHSLELLEEVFLVCLPVMQHGGDYQGPLMPKKCTCSISTKAHVTKYKQYLVN